MMRSLDAPSVDQPDDGHLKGAGPAIRRAIVLDVATALELELASDELDAIGADVGVAADPEVGARAIYGAGEIQVGAAVELDLLAGGISGIAIPEHDNALVIPAVGRCQGQLAATVLGPAALSS